MHLESNAFREFLNFKVFAFKVKKGMGTDFDASIFN